MNGVICSGGSATLTANPSSTGGIPSYTYLWSDATTSNPDNVNPASTTTYVVTVTNDGCSNATAMASSTVAIAPPINVTISETDNSGFANDGAVCLSGSANLTATPAGGGNYTYHWTSGSTAGGITVTPGTTSTYGVTVTDAGCTTATANYTVTVDAIKAVPTGNAVMCYGYPIYAGVSNGIGSYVYSWSGGLQSESNPPVTTAGTYTVNVTDDENCTASGSFVVTQINPLPNANISGGQIVYANSPPVNITFTGSGTVAPYTFTYRVSFNGGSPTTLTVTSGNLNLITNTNNPSNVATVLCSTPANQVERGLIL